MKTESDSAVAALIVGIMLFVLAIATFGEALSAFAGAIATIAVGTAALLLARQQLQTIS